MKNKITLLTKYIQYLLTAKTKHGVHSPFVYNLLTTVINDNSNYYAYAAVEKLRQSLLLDKREIQITDFGAGSQQNNARTKSVATIAKNAAKPAKYGQLLFRLVNFVKPNVVLELGTSLGISTAYQGLARTSAQLITMEGCPQTAAVAKENLITLGLNHANIVIGNFDETLPQMLSQIPQIDYAFFDGNHQKQPTINYFEQCLAKVQAHTLFVFDDIHWSAEMEEAWEYIKNHPKTTVTIDLFFIGLVFFRPQQAKEHFVLKY